ncbi:guanylate kinase-like [Sitophilus oryzae]|uniref:guanylate kinase n=1 Tax=Sitophilus oryzae TaxID=7048 RepID=A0A6J2YHZ3_SITOR|nr:guanylate kinase-like [Sitophilus oryzae]
MNNILNILFLQTVCKNSLKLLKSIKSLREVNHLNKGLSTMHNKNSRPLLFCGPSGSGKSTLVKRLMDDFPDHFGFIISHTTRNPRQGEIHGQHYYFTDENTMKQAIENGEFVEHAVFGENIYGTSFKALEDIVKQGKLPILDIEMQGVKQVKQTRLNPWCVFIQPPSMSELRKRLIKRKTETEESLERRLNIAREEIMYGLGAGNFDKIIVNDDFEKAYRELKDFVEDNVLVSKITTEAKH